MGKVDNMQKQIDSISREMESLRKKKKYLEIRNSVTEMIPLVDLLVDWA